MTNLAIREFNNQTIRFREDGYVCLTDMAKATGKKTNDWLRLTSSTSYLEVLSGITGITVNQLIEVNVGNLGQMSGTWGHPKVAIRFAQWCSDDFAVQVDFWVDELLTTGKVHLESTEAVPQLPPSDIRVTNLMSTLEKLGVELDNPRLKQPLADMALNILGVTKALPGVSGEYQGVAELAEQLGYSATLVAKHRSSLGRFVKKTLSDTQGVSREKRLVNGTYRPVLVYRKDSPEVQQAITTYFNRQGL